MKNMRITPTLSAQVKSVQLKLFNSLQQRNACSDLAKDIRTVCIDTFLCLCFLLSLSNCLSCQYILASRC